jgi:hypothetical protein
LESLKNLQLDYVDVIFAHRSVYCIPGSRSKLTYKARCHCPHGGGKLNWPHCGTKADQ